MKIFTKKSIALLLSLLLIISVAPISVMALGYDVEIPLDGLINYLPEVYVASTGSDENTGTENSPVATLNKAIELVKDQGKVILKDTITLPTNYSWATHYKTVTITGGGINVTHTILTLGDGVIFDNTVITLPLTYDEENNPKYSTLYANGKTLKVNENVTVTNPISVYGGASANKTVYKTDVTLLGGTYAYICGGGYKSTVTTNTNLYVGGSVNSDIDVTNHSGVNRIYGGSYGGTINGTANLTFEGNAKARYIYGGNRGTGTITGGTNTYIKGGQAMSIYGGSSGVYEGNVNLEISGGTFEQVFGGNESGALTGNVTLNLKGGTITRRVYGGCYNNYASLSWQSSYYVIGDIKLILTDKVDINFTYNDNDRSIYAHSRQKTLSSTENSAIIYNGNAAKTKYENKLTAQDTTMKFIMGSTSAADSIHLHGFTADDTADTITEGCSIISGSVSSCGNIVATLTIDSSVDLVHNGQEIKPATFTTNGSFTVGEPVITYLNNINPGTATATLTYNGVSVSKEFAILPTPAATFEIIGASIRKEEGGKPQALRFKFDISRAIVDGSYSDYTVSKYGAIVSVKNTFGDVLDMEDVTAQKALDGVAYDTATGKNILFAQDEYTNTYTMALYNIGAVKDAQGNVTSIDYTKWSTVYTARAYIVYSADGKEDVCVYSDEILEGSVFGTMYLIEQEGTQSDREYLTNVLLVKDEVKTPYEAWKNQQ